MRIEQLSFGRKQASQPKLEGLPTSPSDSGKRSVSQTVGRETQQNYFPGQKQTSTEQFMPGAKNSGLLAPGPSGLQTIPSGQSSGNHSLDESPTHIDQPATFNRLSSRNSINSEGAQTNGNVSGMPDGSNLARNSLKSSLQLTEQDNPEDSKDSSDGSTNFMAMMLQRQQTAKPAAMTKGVNKSVITEEADDSYDDESSDSEEEDESS